MSVITGQLWDQLYAVAHGHQPTAQELAGRFTVLAAGDPEAADAISREFTLEVLRTIAGFGDRASWMAEAALTVLGEAK
jgi:hypothetical protein